MEYCRWEEIAWARVDMPDPFLEYCCAGTAVTELPEVDGSCQKLILSDGITPILGRNIPSVRVVWHYDWEFMTSAVAESRDKQYLDHTPLVWRS